MLYYKAESKDIQGCGTDFLLTLPMEIDADGTNTKTRLEFINIAYKTDSKGSYQVPQSDRNKIWRSVRTTSNNHSVEFVYQNAWKL